MLYYFCFQIYIAYRSSNILHKVESMLLEGIQLGRYQLLNLLGSGGMGEVYVGEDTHIHRQVAIKVIRAEATPYPNSEAATESSRLFQREVRAIATLDHPNILPLFDYGEENMKGTILTYMVMPYRVEGSLSTWLQQRGGSQLVTPQEAAHFIRQAAAALSYAHNHKIIHQDVKPSNFLVRNNEEDTNRPDLLLADFGIAKFTSASASMSQTSRGTPTYMAPEQWSGHPVAATDQYALAIMTYQLLTGKLPFQGRQEQVMYMHFNEKPKPPGALNSNIPKDVDTVLLRALAKKPEERFSSISAFANAYQQALPASGSSITVQALQSSPPSTDEDIRATLAISQAEAQIGTTRTLNLPRGRRISVPIPSGIPDGQVIRFEGQGEPSTSGQSGALILTITIAPLEETILPSKSSEVEDKTYRSASNKLPEAPSPLSKPNITQRFRRLILSRPRIAILIGLVLLVVLGSFGIFYFKYDNFLQKSSLLNAAIANPYPPNTGTLALNDPLSDNSNGYFWGENNDSGGACQFSNGAFHVSVSQQGTYHSCTAGTTNYSNFTYQVQMTIVQGDSGGIIFRTSEANGAFYYFHIGIDGSYALDLYNNNNFISTLKSGSNTAINSGLNQSNLIAVVASGSNITLYVNNQSIDSVTDNTYSQGEIGVAASSIGNTASVVFTNAKVWTL
jgi:eukaryotic-like serine/threonine-protein kinase